MKQAIAPAYIFTPSGTPGLSTLNLSGIANFNIALLYAVINLTRNAMIYVAGSSGAPGLGYVNLSGSTLTLAASLAGHTSGDQLLVLYEVGVSNGLDASMNPPAIPNVGQAFGSTGPYANYVLVGTIAASAARANIDIENTSGSQIVIVRDDGTAAVNAAPNNASAFALAGGSSVGSQGGDWNSQTFKGRIQIYAPPTTAGGPGASAFVTVMQE